MKTYLDIVSQPIVDLDIVQWRLQAAHADLARAVDLQMLGAAEALAEEIEAYEGALRHAVCATPGTRRPSGLLALAIALLACLLPALAQAQDKEPLPTGPVQSVLTAYCSCVACSGDFPGKIRGQTASGKMAQAGRTLAAPKDLPFGTEILVVEGDGKPGRLSKGVVLGVVEDRGGAIRWRKGAKTGQRVLHIDVFFDSHKEAREWGVKAATVQIVLPKERQ